MNLVDFVKVALKEDIPSGDITTDGLSLGNLQGSAALFAKQDLILSGTAAFIETFKQVDPLVQIAWNFKDGSRVTSGQIICHISGPNPGLLKGERTALNFLGHLSGVATKTALFVEKTKGSNTKITDTRKTTPGFRLLEKEAVLHGGGTNHRMNLSTGILVKENHIRAAGGIPNAVKTLRLRSPGLPIEVEVTNLTELNEALSLKVERVLLDNMTLQEMKSAVEIVAGRCETEASGNMTLDRIESVAKLGVDYISVGALTHSAANVDLSLLFNMEKK